MTSQPSADPLVRAVAAVVLADPQGYAARPSRFRSRLVTELGGGADHRPGGLDAAYRTDVHLLTAAVEEQLPARLRSTGVFGADDLAAEATELARVRGWTPAAAERVVTVWAQALEHAGLRATDPPPPARSDPPGDDGASHVTANVPTEDGAAEPNRAEPGADHPPQGMGEEGRALVREAPAPPPQSDGIPAHWGAPLAQVPHPGPTDGPLTGPPTGAAPFPQVGALPHVEQQHVGVGSLPQWPPAARFLGAGRQPGQARYVAFRGRHPLLRVAVLAGAALVVTLLMLLVRDTPMRMTGVAVVAATAVLATASLVQHGIATADEGGLRWQPTRGRGIPLAVTWSHVRLAPGVHPRLDTPEGAVWLGFRAHRLAAAIRARTERDAA